MNKVKTRTGHIAPALTRTDRGVVAGSRVPTDSQGTVQAIVKGKTPPRNSGSKVYCFLPPKPR